MRKSWFWGIVVGLIVLNLVALTIFLFAPLLNAPDPGDTAAHAAPTAALQQAAPGTAPNRAPPPSIVREDDQGLVILRILPAFMLALLVAMVWWNRGRARRESERNDLGREAGTTTQH